MWRLRGFRTHVFAFGWEDTASNYHEKQTCLNDYARSLDGDVYLIGASAGGMAALHALAGDNGNQGHRDNCHAVYLSTEIAKQVS